MLKFEIDYIIYNIRSNEIIITFRKTEMTSRRLICTSYKLDMFIGRVKTLSF